MLRTDLHCEECTRLWRALKTATHDYFRVDGKLKTAAISHNAAAVAELRPLLREAERQRQVLRTELDAHEQKAHAEVTSLR
jgi:hypothetical protein